MKIQITQYDKTVTIEVDREDISTDEIVQFALEACISIGHNHSNVYSSAIDQGIEHFESEGTEEVSIDELDAM